MSLKDKLFNKSIEKLSNLADKVGGLKAAVIGATLIAGVTTYTVIKKNEFSEQFNRPSSAITIETKTQEIAMIDDSGKKSLEEVAITVDLDREKNILYIGNYTQDYKREDWEGSTREKMPLHKRHTRLNSEATRIFVLHPKEISFTSEQTAFLIPTYQWESLKPFEEHEGAQKIMGGAEKIMENTIFKIPFTEEILEKLIEYSDKNREEYRRELNKKTGKDYMLTRISPHIPEKLIGNTETAREYKVFFDVSNIQKKEVPIYLIANVYLGDPTESANNSFPNKRGETKDMFVSFKLNENMKSEEEKKYIEPIRRKGGTKSLEKKVVENEKGYVEKIKESIPEISFNKLDFEDYFFQGRELKHLKLSGTPLIIDEDALSKYGENITKFWIADYWLQPLGGYGRSFKGSLYVIEFASKEDLQNYPLQNNNWIADPKFIGEKTISMFAEGFLIDSALSSNPMYINLTEKQKIEYIRIIENYQKRTRTEMKGADKEELKKYKERLLNEN